MAIRLATMSLNGALACGYVFPRAEHATAVDASAVDSWTPESGWLWVHLDRTHASAECWLRDTADLDPLAVEALLAEETRPRATSIREGLLVILRGVNLNVGADPEDMISIRIWIDATRIISLRARTLMAIQNLRERGIEVGMSSPICYVHREKTKALSSRYFMQ